MWRLVTPVALLFLVMLGALLGGLTPVAATQDGEPKILRIWWSDLMPESLEPQTNESGIADLSLLVYEGLTRFDEERNVVPAAAESWEFSDDGLTITFHLRDNLTYSDGSPLTAERFRYAIARTCDPAVEFNEAETISDIVGCEELRASSGNEGIAAARESLGVRARDERTLEISLRRPAPYFPALARWVNFLPVKQELVEADGPEWWRDPANWVGNGPFRLDSIEPDAIPPRVTMAANERYWGGRPKLDGIEYLIMESRPAFEAYKRNELDILPPSAEALPEIEADPVMSRELVSLPSPFVGLFHLNLTKEPFTDKKVREAFAYAFDREAYCLEIQRGACTQHLSWIPSGVPGAIETDLYAFDPIKARDALAASSYGGPDNLPEITWYYIAGYSEEDDAWELEQAEWVSAQFRQVLGVDLTLTPATWDEFNIMFDDVATFPQIEDTYWWSGLPDPHEWLAFWTCGAESFAARIGYCNPQYDALVEQSDLALDPEERTRLAEEAHALLIADSPALFGYRWDAIYVVKSSVTGFSRTAPDQGWPGWATPLTLDIVPAA